jgi:hypothetical protein
VTNTKIKATFSIIITIIIIIGKTALLEPLPSLEDSATFVHSRLCREFDHPVFTSLDFVTTIFLQSKVVSLASNP